MDNAPFSETLQVRALGAEAARAAAAKRVLSAWSLATKARSWSWVIAVVAVMGLAPVQRRRVGDDRSISHRPGGVKSRFRDRWPHRSLLAFSFPPDEPLTLSPGPRCQPAPPPPTQPSV